MHGRRLLTLLALVLPLPAQASLAELPAIARARSERQRPAQEKALEPYWQELALDYRENRKFLDPRIAQIAAIGDSVVPLLLEKLTPTGSGAAAKNLAGNCRRVLEQLDPASFVDALIELLNSSNDVSRTEALRLLGRANTPTAAAVLTDFVERSTGDDRLLALRSLARLQTSSPAPKIVGLLGVADAATKEAALECLIAGKAAQVLDTVLQAMAAEKSDRMLRLYIDYLAATATEHEAAANALLPLLERDRLDHRDALRVVQALATVAPKDHAPTTRRLLQIIDDGDTGELGLAAGLSLRALGDRSGLLKLRRNLTNELSKAQRKREPGLHELRGNLYFAIENYDEAVADYQKALELTDGAMMTRRLQLRLVRTEAHRRKWQNMVGHLKNAAVGYDELMALAAEDPAVQEALQSDRVKAYVQSLPREAAPGGTSK